MWTLGYGCANVILHWVGAVSEEESGVSLFDWSAYVLPYADDTPVFAIWGSGAGDQWVTGKGAILHHE